MQFSEDIIKLMEEKFPGKNIYQMSLEELKAFKEEVTMLRQEYSLLELGTKTLANAAYGASANAYFYFFNVSLAADITGECRHLTKTMWHNLEEFFHETLWERKDLWKQFDFELDESKHDWYRQQTISIYSDTDSIDGKSLLQIKHIKNQISIEDLYNNCLKKFGQFNVTDNNKEIVECDDKILNYVNNKLEYVPIKYIIRHKVSKSRFKIKTKSGKEIIVTNDHSCIVFRNGKKISIKAKDINKDTDKILSINNYNLFSYIIEDIESIEQLDDFNDEYVYDIEVNDNSHTFIANDILVHNSVYTTYGTLFQAMTPESQKKYDTDEKKAKFILKFNQEFLDKQNTKWCEEIYNPRHGKSVHNFELETISKAGIYLAKKKYIKGLAFNKGKFTLDNPKMSGTGIEIIKSTTPKLCRTILTELTKSLMFEFDDSTPEKRDEYIMYFNEKLNEYRKQFYTAPIEDISQSVGVGNYKKYIIDDTNQLILGKQCPVSVQSVARFNYLAHKNGEDSKKFYSGKIKYYNISTGMKKDDIGYFGFPAGELPEWAPKINKLIQWQKTVIEPINRFLEVMKIPLVNASGTIQLELF